MNANVNVANMKIETTGRPVLLCHDFTNILENKGENIMLFLKSNYPEIKVNEEKLVEISIENLGLPRGATLNVIYSLASQKDLKLIEKSEILSLLESHHKSPAIIATTPEITNYGQFVLFKLTNKNQQSKLILSRGGNKDFFEPKQIFIFKK